MRLIFGFILAVIALFAFSSAHPATIENIENYERDEEVVTSVDGKC